MKNVTARPGTELRFISTFGGRERHKVFYASSIVVGRASNAGRPDFDLSPDQNVSRRHARIWLEEDDCWLEDLGSKFGTKVEGMPVTVGEKASLKPGNLIQVRERIRVIAVDAIKLGALNVEQRVRRVARDLGRELIDAWMHVAVRKSIASQQTPRDGNEQNGFVESHGEDDTVAPRTGQVSPSPSLEQ